MVFGFAELNDALTNTLKAIESRFNDVDVETSPDNKRAALVDLKYAMLDVKERVAKLKSIAERNGLLEPDLEIGQE